MGAEERDDTPQHSGHRAVVAGGGCDRHCRDWVAAVPVEPGPRVDSACSTKNVGELFRRALAGAAKWFSIILPAIAPDVITALRLTVGLSWLVVVAAEMLGCRDGLGYAVWDSRNGLRMDLLIVAMITIGLIGVIVDRLLVRL